MNEEDEVVMDASDSYEEMPDYSEMLDGEGLFGPSDEEDDEEFGEDMFFPEDGIDMDDDEDEEGEEELPQFFLLWNTKNDFYYTAEEGSKFLVFTDPDFSLPEDGECVAKSLECTKEELFTMLYNQGFTDGYVDNRHTPLKKDGVLFFDKNDNRLCYERYLLTKDDKWLAKISKDKLWSLCKVTEKHEALFAIAIDETSGDSFVLAFTDKKSIPTEIKEKYAGFSIVRNPLDEPYLINLTTIGARKE